MRIGRNSHKLRLIPRLAGRCAAAGTGVFITLSTCEAGLSRLRPGILITPSLPGRHYPTTPRLALTNEGKPNIVRSPPPTDSKNVGLTNGIAANVNARPPGPKNSPSRSGFKSCLAFTFKQPRKPRANPFGIHIVASHCPPNR